MRSAQMQVAAAAPLAPAPRATYQTCGKQLLDCLFSLYIKLAVAPCHTSRTQHIGCTATYW